MSNKKQCEHNTHEYFPLHGHAVCKYCDSTLSVEQLIDERREIIKERNLLLYIISRIRTLAYRKGKGAFNKQRILMEIEVMMNPEKHGVKYKEKS